MTRANDDLKRDEIRDWLSQLDPQRFHAQIKAWMRGGLPSNSVPEAISGSASPVLPGFDRFDALLRKQDREYSAKINEAAVALRAAAAIQSGVLSIAPPAPDEQICKECGVKPVEAGRDVCAGCRKAAYRDKVRRGDVRQANKYRKNYEEAV